MAPRLIEPDLIRLFQQEDRSHGLHVSAGIHRVMRQLHPDRFTGESIDVVRALLGNAMENAIADAMARADPDRYMRPGELEFEGVYGTPDLWDVKDWRTIEIKLTWASSARAEDIDDPWFWRYWCQLQSYAHMAGQTRGALIIFFINGNYRRDDPEGSKPKGLMWEDEWSTDDLQENWEMVKAQAEAEFHGEDEEDE